MRTREIALLVALIATSIYGITFTVAKDVMPLHIKPFGFILLRVGVATSLFWIVGSLFFKSEPIERQDFLRLIAAALFGIAINMLSFFKGLSYTTPINAAVIMATAPIMVFVFSIFLLKEKILIRKIIGIAIGLIGTVILILYGQKSSAAGSNIPLGNLLVFINATSYSLYLVIAKKLTVKYHPFTFARWIYLIGFLMVLPFGFQEFSEVQWHFLPIDIWWKIGFIVVLSTFVTYLFNLYALTKLKPTTVGIFIYLQPVVATIYALNVGSDSLNTVKIIATICIFIGIYLVSVKFKKKQKYEGN
ncbi:MAG: DMT family transporter [Flavobacteriaceae bacterium]|nr:DMT family transporter [Flavobacteriaceae bacterium]